MGVTTQFPRRVQRQERRKRDADRRSRLALVVGAMLLASVTAAAFPVSAGARAAPPAPKSSGTEVVDGCTVVLHPTRAHFTECPGQDLSQANFSFLDLRFADFSGSNFIPGCEGVFGQNTFCAGAVFDHTDLDHAEAEHAVFGVCCGTAIAPTSAEASFFATSMRQFDATGATFGDLSGLDLRRANLTGADVFGGFTGSDLTAANLSGASVSGILALVQGIPANFSHSVLSATNFAGADVSQLSFQGATITVRTNFEGAEIQFSDLTGTKLVPTDRTVPASSSSGAVVKWKEPKARPGASPGACTPSSGSLFAVGVTSVVCTINGGPGLPTHGGPNTASGSFTVTVQ